jgi:hypothetical protein
MAVRRKTKDLYIGEIGVKGLETSVKYIIMGAEFSSIPI